MNIKFPSIDAIIRTAQKSFLRFPFVVLTSIIGSFLLIDNIESQTKEDWIWKTIICLSLGLSLFTAAVLFAESKKLSANKKLGLQLLGLLLLLIYYLVLPSTINSFRNNDWYRYILLAIAIHMFTAFSPYVNNQNGNGFWQFNKTLFLRFLTAMLYTMVLYVGLSLALLAIDNLFFIKIKGERYSELFVFLSGIFNTWFFISGIPENLEKLEDEHDYPKSLKVFTQYVLLPLVTIYLIILYSYLVKIIINWQLPQGWVSYLVLGFSIVGIFALLLIWPIRDNEENAWMKTYSRWFYRALYPLVLLLGLAIYKRVDQYGITENRYFILLLAAWLLGISTYFLVAKSKSIKVIPASLFVLALFSAFGPWGAFSISENNQVMRLKKVLVKNNVLLNGLINKNHKTLSIDDRIEVTSIVQYLNRNHGLHKIQPWFGKQKFPFDSLERYDYRYTELLGLMNIESANESDRKLKVDPNRTQEFSLSNYNNTELAISIGKYDYWLRNYSTNTWQKEERQYKFTNEGAFKIDFNPDSSKLIVHRNEKIIYEKSMDELFKLMVKENKLNVVSGYGELPLEKSIIEDETQAVSIKFILSNLSGTIKRSDIHLTAFDGDILIRFKN